MPNYPHSSLWPTKPQYLWLLRTEACHRGLLFASKPIDHQPGPFSCDDADEWYDGDLTPDQWLDVSNFTKQETSRNLHQNQDELERHAKTTESTKRRALLKMHAWLYLDGIQKNIEEKLLAAGATKSQNPCPEDAVLHDIGTLWTLAEARKHEEEQPQARLGIFSDIPQEGTSIEYINLPYNMTFANFKTQAASLGIVRHLTKKHHPELAKTIFLDDETVYHHPYPTAIDQSDPSFPPEIYPVKQDYEAENHGWYAHVAPLDTTSMFNQQRDWRPVNTESDWQSLLRVMRNPDHKIFMRHKSVEDRMDFVKRHREREELEVAKTGGFYTNLFLDRHMEVFCPKGKLEVPVHPDQSSCGDEWLRRITDQQRREGEVFEDEVKFFAQL